MHEAISIVVIIPVLGTRSGVKIKLDTKTIFARPVKRFERIFPTGLSKEWFIIPNVDSPVRNGQTDPVESSACNLGEIFLRLQ